MPNLSSQTIVLFSRDHVHMISQLGLRHEVNTHWIAGGERGARRPNMFDESIRVPLLLRWPGGEQAGTGIAEAVASIGTLASILGE